MTSWLAAARAFRWPILLAVALAVGFFAGKRWEVGNTLAAHKALSDVQADMATQAAAAEADAARRLENAFRVIRERDQTITSILDGIPAAVARQLAPKFAQIRSDLNDPTFDCIRTVALPESVLRELRRPGGSAAAEDHPDPDTR